MSEMMTGAEMVVRALQDQGVEMLFGYPGGAVLPIYDALFHQDEAQATSSCATSRARPTPPRAMRARPARSACVLVTSGPGATNAVTGLTDALMDSIPLVCITGQVPTHLIGSDAFQECDTVGITRHCTKHNYLVKSHRGPAAHPARGLLRRLERPPGPGGRRHPEGHPVRERRLSRPDRATSTRPIARSVKGDLDTIRAAVELMADGQAAGLLHRRRRHQFRPARRRRCCASSCALTGLPITSTLMGLGAFPASDPQWLGMLGMHGTYEANNAMHDCDVMISIGARFDDRITGRLDAFSPNSQEDPHRHRPVLDQQERQGRHRHRRRLRRMCWRTWSRLWRAAAPQVDKAALADWWEQDRRLARAQLLRLPATRRR